MICYSIISNNQEEINMREVIKTNNAPGAIGPYSQGIKIENLIFTSGQLPIENGDLLTEIKEATKASLNNIKSILEEADSSMDKIIKTTIFLKNLNDFESVNEVYASYFDGNPPARSCVQVAKLPKDALIEIEAIAKL